MAIISTRSPRGRERSPPRARMFWCQRQPRATRQRSPMPTGGRRSSSPAANDAKPRWNRAGKMDPNEFRETGHRVVDLLADYLARIEDLRVFPDVEPRELHALFDEPLPSAPSSSGDVLRELEEK